jgi:hypothetical protein
MNICEPHAGQKYLLNFEEDLYSVKFWRTRGREGIGRQEK